MKRFLTGVLTAAAIIAGSVSAFASEVLVVTWQGKLVSEEHFEKYLKQMRPDVKFTYIDADRKKGTLAQALRAQDMSKVDLVYSFGTTGTKIVKEFLKGSKPHVFNIVSAPVESGIADSIEKPGGNLTGARYLVDLDLQLDILGKLRDYKKLAVWFDPREKQNQIVVDGIQAICEKKGIALKIYRIVPDGKGFDEHLKKAAEETNQMDALYIAPSSSYSGRYKELHAHLDPKLLVMGTVNVYVQAGSTVAVGANWEERSKTVAEMAAKILGGAKADEMPISQITQDKVDVFINKDKMDQVGLKDLDKLGMKITYINEKKD